MGFTTNKEPIRLRNGFGVTGGGKSQPGGPGGRSVDPANAGPAGHDVGADARLPCLGVPSAEGG